MTLAAKIRDALARDDGSERSVLRENSAEILAALEENAQLKRQLYAYEKANAALTPNAQRYLAMKDDTAGLIEELICTPFDLWDGIVDEYRDAARNEQETP